MFENVYSIPFLLATPTLDKTLADSEKFSFFFQKKMSLIHLHVLYYSLPDVLLMNTCVERKKESQLKNAKTTSNVLLLLQVDEILRKKPSKMPCKKISLSISIPRIH